MAKQSWKDDRTAPLSLYFSFLNKKYLGAMMNTMMNKLSHVELERYFVVLSVIDQSGESFTQQNLANYFQMDKASVVRVVDYLVQREVIVRQVNTQDRREYFLVLTEKGKCIVPEIRQSISQLNETALRHFTLEQTEQFFLALDTIGQNLSEAPNDEVFLNFHKVSARERPKATAALPVVNHP